MYSSSSIASDPSSGSASVSRQPNETEALILDYVYHNQLLKDTIHLDMWQQFVDEVDQDFVSPSELKLLFHCQILKNLGEYNIPYEKRIYFSGLTPFPRIEVVMRENDFLLGRDFVANEQPPHEDENEDEPLTEMEKLFYRRPFDEPAKLAVVSHHPVVAEYQEMPAFMRLMYSSFLEGVTEGEAAKSSQIVSAYMAAVSNGDAWLDRIEEDSIINMAARIDMNDLIELFNDWDIEDDERPAGEMPTPGPASRPLSMSTPVSNAGSRTGLSRPYLSTINEHDLDSDSSFTEGLSTSHRIGDKRTRPAITDPMEGTSTMYGKQWRRA